MFKSTLTLNTWLVLLLIRLWYLIKQTNNCPLIRKKTVSHIKSPAENSSGTEMLMGDFFSTRPVNPARSWPNPARLTGWIIFFPVRGSTRGLNSHQPVTGYPRVNANFIDREFYDHFLIITFFFLNILWNWHAYKSSIIHYF
jgi:hypothetical protein